MGKIKISFLFWSYWIEVDSYLALKLCQMKAEMLVWTGEWHQSLLCLSGSWCSLNLCGWNYPQGMCRGEKSFRAKDGITTKHVRHKSHFEGLESLWHPNQMWLILPNEAQKPGYLCHPWRQHMLKCTWRCTVDCQQDNSVLPSGECRGVLSTSVSTSVGQQA